MLLPRCRPGCPAVQDVSSMIRFGANPIILLINNKGYTIEIEIHDGEEE